MKEQHKLKMVIDYEAGKVGAQRFFRVFFAFLGAFVLFVVQSLIPSFDFA